MTFYTSLLRSFLFRKDPEEAHEMVTQLLIMAAKSPILSHIFKQLFPYASERLRVKSFGLTFENPVGLAAGFDKNALLINAMPLLGFGFIEIGTVTGKEQVGNPKPRLFRLSKDHALINRMGFNNDGTEKIRERLNRLRRISLPLGINIGKSKDVPLSQAVEDYLFSFEALYRFGHYFVINVSSPNTPNLRQLQERALLDDLVQALTLKNRELAVTCGIAPKPLLVKIAPDLTWPQIDDLVGVVQERKIDGIIATNTTIARDRLVTQIDEGGGLSGKPLRERSTQIISYLYRATGGKIALIGVGGIFSAQDAYEKIKAGASLVQIYTGLIYEGPSLVRRINKGIIKLLEGDGFKEISEAVGQNS
ncbi:MAG: quinone-dependent dihydroorotate dehydrogenase [Candidatus Tectomicrobia bacterium]|nr:quinone-dependent dihydroorotate dehydrogenase [Candidatus Tectomicrobia bacterium]